MKKVELIRLCCIAFALVCGGCGSELQEATKVTLRDKTYQLKNAEDAHAVDLTRAELIACSDDERMGIARCLGRIPVTNMPIKRVVVAWAERPLAARVEVGPDVVGFL